MSISQFRLTYEISPIILTGGGITENVSGGMMPIISLIQSNDFSGGLLSGGDGEDFNDFVAHFLPVPGATLIDNQVGMYPFANQSIAANAIIAQPLKVSLMMIAPAPVGGGYQKKLAAFTSLKKSLDQHNLAGGTYIVATPSYLYTDCLLTGMRDVSSGEGEQVQIRWMMEFLQPLLTLEAARAAQNSLMARSTAGVQLTGDPPSATGTANAVGTAQSGVGPPLIPAARSTGGASAAQSTAPAASPVSPLQRATGTTGGTIGG